MRKVMMSLLMLFAPVCFCAPQSAPAQQYKHQVRQTQPQKQQTVTANQASAVNQPKTVVKQIPAQPKKVIVKTTRIEKPKTKHVIKRRIVKRHRAPVVVEEHVYEQPRQVVVRRTPQQRTVVVRRHRAPAPAPQGQRVVRRYRYEEPRVMVRPAPVQMSFGYVFR